MYYLTVVSFLLQYLMNAKVLISSRSDKSKPTLMIPNNSIYIYVERRILDKVFMKLIAVKSHDYY
jgi:hypothetical protein